MNNISDKSSNNPMLKNIGAFLLISAIFVVGIYIGRMNPDPKELDAKGYSITGDLKSEFENVDVNSVSFLASTQTSMNPLKFLYRFPRFS